MTKEPDKTTVGIDAEYLSGHRFPYQEDMSLVEDVDLLAATPGEDINWLEDVELLVEDGLPAVFDRHRAAGARLRGRPRCPDQRTDAGRLVRARSGGPLTLSP